MRAYIQLLVVYMPSDSYAGTKEVKNEKKAP